MVCRSHRVGFQAIALVLSAAIAWYPNWGYAYSPAEDEANSASSPPRTQAKSGDNAGQLPIRDNANGENHPPPSSGNPSGFLVLEIQLTGEDSVSLSWSDLGPDFVYTVESCDSFGEGSWRPCEPVEQWPTSATSWTDTSAIGSGARFYRIFTEALSEAPSAPENVSATVSGGDLVIRWDEVGGASSYNMYWSSDEKFTPLDANKIEGVASPYIHSDLGFGTTYYYMVTAVGNMGESEVSSVASAALVPPLDRTVASTLSATSAFLYTGNSPIQTGMAPATIEPKRVAVLRGKVLNRDGDGLSEVTITVLTHAEFGQTLSRDDGMFDMAVNGGGYLTVNYFKDGYLRAQRQIGVPWQDYALLPDVVLIPRDAEVTTVDLTTGTMQVATGSVTTDNDGTRQATLLFPEGTSASLEFPDGTTQPIAALSVRATEFTVGDSGPNAMPAELPPTSGYTYCVEFNVDEAEAAGAKNVLFDSALPAYVENFLDFPVGGAVPVGYYDADRGGWVPSDNGRIIAILSVEGGLAQLDVDGSGMPADAAALSDLGITAAEREQLASLYAPGQSLWRFPIAHFTPWDCNWPYGPPSDARPPGVDGLPAAKGDKRIDTRNCSVCGGSFVELENQILMETIGIAGTPFSLHYASDRAPGRCAAYKLEIPLSGAEVPASLKRIELEIQVAGRRFAESLPAEPDQTYEFAWDGKDAYGRMVQGQQVATVAIGYVYGAVYQEPAQVRQSFGALSGVPMTGSQARQELTLWQKKQVKMGTWDARAQGLGGWTLDIHHAYDPVGRVLYYGNGSRDSAQSVNSIITTVAGNGNYGYNGDDIPATETSLSHPMDVAVGLDGSVYIADGPSQRIRRIDPDGVITTVAGNGQGGYNGDAIPAVEAKVHNPEGLAFGPDGSLYIADKSNNRIRRIDPDGIITTVAGNGGYVDCEFEDGMLATGVSFRGPTTVAIGPDGSIYTGECCRILRVAPDGILTIVAGNGSAGYGGDGGPALEAQLYTPVHVALGPDGSIYVQTGNKIRRVGPDGIINTVAGSTGYGFAGDGGPASDALFDAVYDITVGPDGCLYILDQRNYRIRCIGTDGIINTVAGDGTKGFSGDGGPPHSASLTSHGESARGPTAAFTSLTARTTESEK